jgi:hypothetical protein
MIVGNVFTDIGGSGISIGKFTANEATEYHIAYDPTDKNEICTRDTIANNYITNVTTELQGRAGSRRATPRTSTSSTTRWPGRISPACSTRDWPKMAKKPGRS